MFNSFSSSYTPGRMKLGIITSGLVFHIDALKYSGSGEEWSSLSGPQGILYNSPTYTSDLPAYFSFDKNTYQYASTSNLENLNTWTIESWFRVTSNLTGQITTVVCNMFDLVSHLNFSMGTNNAPTDYNISVGFFESGWRNTTGFAPTLNTWYHVVGTYDGSTVKQYVNNALNSQLTYSGTPQSGGDIHIGRRWDSSDTDSINFFPGDISVVRIYDIALTENQVAQNYNAHKKRYGL